MMYPSALVYMAYTWYKKKKTSFWGVVKKSTQTQGLRWVDDSFKAPQDHASSSPELHHHARFGRRPLSPRGGGERGESCWWMLLLCTRETSGIDTCIEFSDMNGIRTLNIPMFNHFQTFHR